MLIFFVIFPKYILINDGSFEKYIKFIVYLGVFTAIFGFFVLFTGIAPIARWRTFLISYITHPNNVSIIFTYTTVTTLFYYYLIKRRISLPFKSVLVFFIIIQLAAQFFSLTRSGMIASILSILIFFLVVYGKKMIVIIPIAMVSMSSIFISFFAAKGFASFMSRFLLLIPAYNMVTSSSQAMLWGHGLSKITEKFQEYMILSNVVEQNIEDPHNSVAYLLIIFGILITLVLLIFIFKHLLIGVYKLFFTKFRSKGELYYLAYLVSIVAALMLHGFFDAELVKPEFYSIQIFAISLSLLRSYNNFKLIPRF